MRILPFVRRDKQYFITKFVYNLTLASSLNNY